MKKRLLSLVLALALCLGLAVPAMAADTSGLDATTATAYLNVLTSEINQYGIVSQSNNSGLEYVALEDMDANGTPELIVIRYDGTAIITAIIKIWTMKGGNAVQTVNEVISAGGTLTERNIFLVRKPGQMAVCDSFEWYERTYSMDNPDEEWPEADGGPLTFQLHYVDGTIEKIRATKVSDIDATRAAFRKAWTADNICLVGGLGLWLHDSEAVETVKQVQATLMSKANEVSSKPTTPTPAPAPSTTATTGNYAPYSISVSDYYDTSTIYFEAAKAERKTVQVKSFSHEPGGSPYESTQIILITVRPGSQITISGTGFWAENGWASGDQGESEGSNRFTIHYSAPNEALFSGPAEKSLANNKMVSPHWTVGELPYFIVLGKDTKPSAPAFRDVPAGEYYAAPVSWAVSKNITNGTSATAFSPDQTCTQAQILTFLYRAVRNGGTADTSDMDKAVSWAREKGMIGGGFDGGKPCTRASAVKFIWQAMDSPIPSTRSSFRDVSSTASYASAVSWAVDAGVTKGTSATTFSPDNTCTRGQIVTFLHRAMG